MRGEVEERERGIIELYYNFNIKNHKTKNIKKMSLCEKKRKIKAFNVKVQICYHTQRQTDCSIT